ncbi:acyltransferase family protein, partial [Kineococcus sp. T13]|uniref:acyltransferase family protein n=1 Tax=Kineococcus vitellinus TaxID=2696565 RepID=UPI00141360E1|nr:acyltransferase family protein [Kineococcus vitellinus]
MTAVAESSPPAPAARPRVPEVRSITGLRIVAAVWVLLFHWKFTPPPEYAGLRALLTPVLDSGHLGVDLFYVVSGFVITLTYLDTLGARPRLGAWWSFWWARVCRVWPAYAVVVVLFGLWLLWRRSVDPAFYAYQGVQPDLGWRSWVEQLLLVQLWHRPDFDGASFVGATWSVSAEMAAYVAFPVLALVLHRLRRLPWWLLVAGAVGLLLPAALRSYRTGVIYWDYSWLERISTEFGAGALVCLAVRRLQSSEVARERAARWAPRLAWLLVAEVVLVVGWAASRPYDRYAVVAVLFPLLVGCLALSERGPSAWLSRPAVVLGGRISYSVYLVHVPVYEVFWTFQREVPQIAPGGPWTAFVVPHLPLVAIALGWVLWRFVEEPGRRRMRALGRRRPAGGRAAPARA